MNYSASTMPLMEKFRAEGMELGMELGIEQGVEIL